MAWSRVQGRGAHHSGTATTQALAYSSNVTAGNLLLACGVWNAVTGSATFTDSQGNTWHPISGSLVNDAGSTVSIQWAWAVAGSSGACTVTGTFPSSANQEMVVVELSGVDTSSPIDTSGHNAGTTASAPNVTLTTAAANEALLMHTIDIDGTSTQASGFTTFVNGIGGIGFTDQKSDPSSSGSTSLTRASTSTLWASSAIAVKLASSGTTVDASGGTATADGGTAALTITTDASGGTATGGGGDATASTSSNTLDASGGTATAGGGTAALTVGLRADDEPTVMPLLSRGVPTDDSAGFGGSNAAANAVDGTHGTYWGSVSHPTSGAPQWLVLDLRTAKASGTWSKVLVAFRNQTRPGYQPSATLGTDASSTFQHLIRDYTIDAHASSGSEPTHGDAGWVTLVTVTDNRRSDPVHTDLDLSSYNWLRVNVTDASGVSGNDDARFELELHDHTDGIEDSFITYGDSITMEAFNDLQIDGSAYVDGPLSAQIEARTGRKVIFQDAATGGWLANDGDTNKVDYVGGLPGKYVLLNFGANDAEQSGIDFVAEGGTTGTHATTYKSHMQSMIDYFAGIGKVCIIPRVSYATLNGTTSEGNTGVIADCVDELLAANPDTTLAGPDLYSFFQAHTNLLRDGLHPTYDQGTPAGMYNGRTGYENYLKLWADTLVPLLYTNSNAAVADGGTADVTTSSVTLDASGGTATGDGGTAALTVALAPGSGTAAAGGGSATASDGSEPPPPEDRPTFLVLTSHQAGLALTGHDAGLALVSEHTAGLALVSEHDAHLALISEHEADLLLVAREADLELTDHTAGLDLYA